MNQPTTIAGYRILDGRYALLECIAISSIGKIYRARDLERAKVQGMDSHVLIHFLPKYLDRLPLETLCQQITQTCKQVADKRVLPLRSYGQDQNNRYVVMDSPATTTISSLEQHSPDQNASLFNELYRLIQPLHKQGLLTAHIDSALVITDSNHSLYLLSSALSPDIQALQSHRAIWAGKRRPLRAVAAGFAVLSLISGISVMAANYIVAPSPIIASSLNKPVITQGMDTPLIQQAPLAPTTHATVVNLANSDRAIQSAATSDLIEQETGPDATTVTSSLQPKVKSESAHAVKPAPQKQNLPKVKKPPQQTKAVTENSQQERKDAKLTKPDSHKQVIVPEPTPTQKPTPETLGINELINLAEQAMNNGKFSSALSYTRLLREQSRLHPQVKRLSRAIVSHYHNQARANLQNRNIKAAEQTLATAVSIIKEFNLVSFNNAQQVLEHKAASLKPAR